MKKMAKVNSITEVVEEQLTKDFRVTTCVFNTAYLISKAHFSYSSLEKLLQLQEKNGLEVGRILRSHHSCQKIASFISAEMRKRLSKHISASCPSLSLMIDESTSLSTNASLIIYLRGNLNGRVENVFLSLVDLHGCETSQHISNTVLKCFDDVALDSNYLKNSLIGMATDGASNMTGRHSGVAAQLKNHYPLLNSFHCMAHRLELATADALKAVTATNHFEIFISELHNVYSQSPKLRAQLQSAAEDINTVVQRIGYIFSIRWVASSGRTVDAVWKSYAALVKHFQTVSLDNTVTSSIRAKFTGLLNKLTSETFVKNLGLMRDILTELRCLSEKLQREDVTVVDSMRWLQQTIQVFTKHKTDFGSYYKKAVTEIEQSGTFKGVAISETSTSSKRNEINQGQIYQALIDSINSRFPDSELVELMKPLYIVNWPENESDLILYGESEVLRLAKKFGWKESCDLKSLVGEFRDWKSNSKLKGSLLNRIVLQAETLPASTAECERGFSQMNLIRTELRNSLSIDHVSDLLFITLNGPDIASWDALPYVRAWIKSGNKFATEAKTGKRRELEDTKQKLISALF